MPKTDTAVETFARIYNDLRRFPRISDVAKELGLSEKTVRNRASVLRGRHKAGEPVPAVISRLNLHAASTEEGFEFRTIETHPDSADEPIEDLLDRAIRHNERYATHKEQKSCIDIQLKIEGSFGVVGIPDHHLNSVGTLLRRAFDDAHAIAQHPALFCVGIGDWLDNFIVGKLERERRKDIMSHSDAWRLLEHYLGILGPKMIAGISGNHCLDEQTQLLTRRGWVHYTDIREEDQALTLNAKSGEAEWQTIQRKIVLAGPSALNRLDAQSVDLFCTDQHRVLHRKRIRVGRENNKWTDLSFSTMETLGGGRIALPLSANTSVSRCTLSDAQLRLAAWVLTDGCIRYMSNPARTPCVSIYQRAEKAHLVEQALTEADYPVFKRSRRTRDTTEIDGRKLVRPCDDSVEFYLSAEESRRFISEILDRKDVLPDWGWNLDNRQFAVFLDALIEGDGTRQFYERNDGTVCNGPDIFYGRQAFCDGLQALCVAHGYAATMSEYRSGDFRVSITKRSYMEIEPAKRVVKEPYQGEVWCVTVPNGNFMCRRSGKAHFTGNCDWSTGLGGVDIMKRYFVDMGLGPIYDPDQVRVRLKSPSGSSFTHIARHKYRGNSRFNSVHAITVWILENWQGEDVVWGGHIHQAGHTQIEKRWMGESRVVHGVQLGAYKVLDDYAVRECFRPNQPFLTPMTIHIPKSGETLFFADMYRGIQVLDLLRRAEGFM